MPVPRSQRELEERWPDLAASLDPNTPRKIEDLPDGIESLVGVAVDGTEQEPAGGFLPDGELVDLVGRYIAVGWEKWLPERDDPMGKGPWLRMHAVEPVTGQPPVEAFMSADAVLFYAVKQGHPF